MRWREQGRVESVNQRCIGPLFGKALKTLTTETRKYLEDKGLDDLGVFFKCFLEDLEVPVRDLAAVPSGVPSLEALLKEASPAARSQIAEFANRSISRTFSELTGRGSRHSTYRSLRRNCKEQSRPSVMGTRRLPSKLARASSLEGDERLRWAGEVADLLLGLDNANLKRAKRAPEPRAAAMRMSGRVRVATLRSYLRPRLEAILELVDCVGRRTAAEELRRSSRLPGNTERQSPTHRQCSRGSERHSLSTKKLLVEQQRRVSRCPLALQTSGRAGRNARRMPSEVGLQGNHRATFAQQESASQLCNATWPSSFGTVGRRI